MPTPLDHSSATSLLSEVNTRMTQALDNFFQRSREDIQETLLRAIAAQITPTMLANGQTCLDWLNAYPDALSEAFARQFRLHLAHPESFEQQTRGQSTQLQLVDDAALGRQLAEEKIAAQLTDTLRPELLLLSGRLQSLMLALHEDHDQTHIFGPLPVIHALSRALDTLELSPLSGTLFIQSAATPLCNTLKHTYTALDRFLNEQGVEEHTRIRTQPAAPSRGTGPAIGQDILAHIQTIAAQHLPPQTVQPSTPANMATPPDSGGFPVLMPHFLDTLAHWQTQPGLVPTAPTEPSAQILRQLQQQARQTDAGSFDLAMLDALAGLFEFILGDTDVSSRYKSAIAQLQVPTLRAALESSDFFDDDLHPARQLIDLLGQFSRRFPDTHPAHADALQQIKVASAPLLNAPDHPTEAFALAHHTLHDWLDNENTHSEVDLTVDIARLQQIENQELGTLLALQNLHDLSARHPAPGAVLQRLEDAWIPYMASLYVAESGEGAQWRDACATLLQLFLSMQTPDPDARETRLQSIPKINAELRRGLLSQGADPAQLKNFFSAITAAQECWIRPNVSPLFSAPDSPKPRQLSSEEVQSLARQLADPIPDDPVLLQTQQLLEGDWVDFDPPYEGLTTARVAWVGVHGYLMFCDSAEEQRFSLDCNRLAAEIRAGRAHIPEQSLTRKAMLRLKTQLMDKAA